MPHDTSVTQRTYLPQTSLTWDDNGQPISPRFNDVYFSKISGIDETRYVFLEQNKLSARFSQLSADQHNNRFIIGETGFGTGLNFLCTWQLFEQTASKNSQLHFFSTEKYPLHISDLSKALSLWPELSEYADLLIQSYLPTSNGFHHLCFSEGRVRLTLLVGDVLDTLPLIEAKVDAWFLDGFAPSKNPDMWQPNLFKVMSEKSNLHATYATYTVARMVRDGLTSAGFSVIKAPGFGSKRNMIYGCLSQPFKQPTHKQPWNIYPIHHDIAKTVAVIGGGLAGTSCAHSLAQRGWHVILFEQHEQLAKEASGNPQGILYAKLSAHNTPLSRLITQGYCYSLNLIRQLDKKHPGTRHACGVIQLCTSERIRNRYLQLDQQYPPEFLQFLDKTQLSNIAGIDVLHDGLFFPESGWVSPPQICQQLVQHQNIRVKTHTPIDQLLFKDNLWLMTSAGKTIFTTKTVVVAGGISTPQLPQLAHIPLQGIRGQITKITTTEQSKKLRVCICGDGYVAPATQGFHTIGATFDFNSNSSTVSHIDHEKNLSMQAKWVPSFSESSGGKSLTIDGGRAGVRSTTPDYLPLVGPVVDSRRFLNDFAKLRTNKKHSFKQTPNYLNGLYVTAGHSSRGLITCPISGELLASMINGDPAPMPIDLIDKLNPVRFLVKSLIRNKA
ncbi:MAG: bifunctional tRNA (5-methylaminomethyl-2-thiouridine)(34)-methyltransferase MnmD/FAD-dependent 5-carboxymethylaminomethyl-2-thiouridine(34) oxidoreductase MnmC [Candidatus Endonucleobacter bathymodioli]|uniref:tRNA 5-methylaminomethyl-2-thiouridine biosynthesis bifunctional protein MnmC n=1 Tax=Candidatus Endonucleibacter bathymodioli TaxID=539814 RepID=A0AA90NZ43_9GAMM|nr:bifunctional tRNA (5-methylaminomethyl-2-thiouridine)(34)-methyltransferase MnmD/FAD-dependent 5-carboxymethylaminomethyl-2-thiouridine(34) oxidoreductase MnmC [Candidatus Endonucleobacter bathymodioli]